LAISDLLVFHQNPGEDKGFGRSFSFSLVQGKTIFHRDHPFFSWGIGPPQPPPSKGSPVSFFSLRIYEPPPTCPAPPLTKGHLFLAVRNPPAGNLFSRLFFVFWPTPFLAKIFSTLQPAGFGRSGFGIPPFKMELIFRMVSHRPEIKPFFPLIFLLLFLFFHFSLFLHRGVPAGLRVPVIARS